MSRIGIKPIEVPNGVEVVINGKDITVKGPKGNLNMTLMNTVDIEYKDSIIKVTRASEDSRSEHGLTRTLIANMITGVTAGFEKRLEINGVGYRAIKQGNKVNLIVGYSHPIEVFDTEDIKIEVPDQNTIIIKGADKQKVGQVAANIRKIKPPEPYKGKGIKYANEYIRRKEGKAGGKK